MNRPTKFNLTNRQFKFRLWNAHLKEWTNPAILKINNKGDMYYQRDGEHMVCQFTGLLDKNGKEIYEGDIMREEYGEKNITVKFDIDLCSCGCCTGYAFNASGWAIGDEIIGNIFENPELLEGKKDEG